MIARERQIQLNVLRRQTDSVIGEIQDAVNRVIASGRYVLGREGEAFETEFAAYCGAAHCVAVANGTDAIELALRAVGIGPGSRVATVANAGAYATTAVLALGAEPVYVDVVLETGLLDITHLRDKLNQERIDCLVVTHLFGRMADVATAVALCTAARVPVIEDCAQAHGARRNGRMCGTFAAAGCFSFYPTKNLGALGDGGCVITDDFEVSRMVRALRQYGWHKKYRAACAGGRNSRLDEIQAAVLRAKLPRLDDWNARRRDIAKRYGADIRNPAIICSETGGEEDVAHLYVVRSADRDGLRERLAAAGIETEVHYPLPDYRQAPVAQLRAWPELAVTELRARTILTLPCYPEMTDEEVRAVIDAVNCG